MERRVKNVVIGFVAALVVAGVAYFGYDLYQARQFARASASYLYAPTDVKDSKGQPLNRAQLIDRVLIEANRPRPVAQAPVPVTVPEKK